MKKKEKENYFILLYKVIFLKNKKNVRNKMRRL